MLSIQSGQPIRFSGLRAADAEFEADLGKHHFNPVEAIGLTHPDLIRGFDHVGYDVLVRRSGENIDTGNDTEAAGVEIAIVSKDGTDTILRSDPIPYANASGETLAKGFAASVKRALGLETRLNITGQIGPNSTGKVDKLLLGGEEVPKEAPGIVASAGLILEKAKVLLPKSVRLRQHGFFIPPKKKPQRFLTLTDALREMGSGRKIILN